MKDDVKKMMDLNFENKKETPEEKVNTLEVKEDSIKKTTELKQVHAMAEQKETASDETYDSYESYAKRRKTSSTAEISFEKKIFNNKENKKETPTKKKAPKQKTPQSEKSYLFKTIWWAFICLLAFIFGIEAIWTFGEKLKQFIDSTKEVEDVSAVLEVIKNFLIAFFYALEVILFTFIIIYSIAMFIKNLKPWLVHKKNTEFDRYRSKINTFKAKINKLHSKIYNNGVDITIRVSINPDENFLPMVNGKKIRPKNYYSELKKEFNSLDKKYEEIKKATEDIK